MLTASYFDKKITNNAWNRHVRCTREHTVDTRGVIFPPRLAKVANRPRLSWSQHEFGKLLQVISHYQAHDGAHIWLRRATLSVCQSHWRPCWPELD